MEKISFEIDDTVKKYCQQTVDKFIDNLTRHHDENIYKTAKDLQDYINNDLQALPNDGIMFFLDDISSKIFDLLRANIIEKKGLILAIIVLVSIDIGNTNDIQSRFGNLLRKILANDIETMELIAYAIGKIAFTSGQNAAEYVDYEIRKAIDLLETEKNDLKKQFSLFILRELAISTPNYFFQHMKNFFEIIFTLLLKETNRYIQETAITSLRAALFVITSRENKEKSIQNNWYSICYDQAITVFNQIQHSHSKSDKLHKEEHLYGTFLILNELLRFSNLKYEKLRQEAEEFCQTNLTSERSDIQSTTSKNSLNRLQEWTAHSFNRGLKSLSLTSYSLTTNSFLYKNSTLIKLSKNFGLLSTASLYNRKIGLCESNQCKQLIKIKFDELCNFIFTNYNFKNNYVQFVYFLLIPRLAAFDVSKFSDYHLKDAKDLLLQPFKKEKERLLQPFLPLGLITVAVQDKIQPYLKEIMNILKAYLFNKNQNQQLNQKKSKSHYVDPAFYTCVGLISKSLKQNAIDDLRELIEPMIESGISPALTNSLFEISNNIPELKNEIQDGLFKILKDVLNNKQFTNHNSLANGCTDEINTMASPQYTNLVILALGILSHFDFQDPTLLQFLRNCTDLHLKSDNRHIRFETVKCCCKLLEHLFQKLSFENTSTTIIATSSSSSSSTNNNNNYTVNLIKTIKNVLQKLLIISVSDEDPEIRYTVLASLNQKFDIELAQPENLNFLLISLKDEIYDIRELSISIVARLSSINPTFVMPTLREIIMELLTDLLYSGTGKNKEICSKILCQLIENAPRITRPYSRMMMDLFLITLKNNHGPNTNNNILIAILNVISSLAAVSSVEITGHFNSLYPILFEIIQDPTYSSKKKEVALSCLGKLIDSTGFEFQSYSTYNELFECLLNLFKTEQTTSMPIFRKEIIRVLGLLGTVDPYEHKLNIGLIDQTGDLLVIEECKKITIDNISSTELLVNKLPNYNDYYPAIAIANLVKIINDPNLTPHHTMAVQALTFIFDCLKLSCVPFISDVIPSFISVIKSSEPTFREYLFQQLCKLVNITQGHIRDFIEDIFQLIKQYWSINQETLINLVEEIAIALGDEFKVYFPRLIPYLLAIFSQDNSKDRHITKKVLITIQKFNTQLSTYFHIILPPLLRLIDNQENSTELRKDSLETIAKISQNFNLSDEACSIIHPLIRTIDNSPDLRDASMNLLCILVEHLGKKYQVFIPLVHNITRKHNIVYQKYDILVNEILSGNSPTANNECNQVYNQLYNQLYNKFKNSKDKKSNKDEKHQQIKQPYELNIKINLNSPEFDRIWNLEQNISKEDWINWLKDFTIILLKKSPSYYLKACNALAQAYSQLSRDLFNSAFISVWNQLDDNSQKKLIQLIERTLQIENTPVELATTVLNLVEFMEHTDKEFQINSRLLSVKAFEIRAYAKALHFIENEFRENGEVLEFLISVNNKLKQPDASTGVLKYANAHQDKLYPELIIKENWYEKLHDWENSLKAYECKLKKNPDDFESVLGQMRSLEMLGEWEKLHLLSKKYWQDSDEQNKSKMSILAASAAWSLGQWDSMQSYCKSIPTDTSDYTFYQAVLAIHKNEFNCAQKFIDESREIIDVNLTAMINESRDRAYATMVQAMLFSELEEVIQFKLIPERKEIIKLKWWTRLSHSQKIVEDWQKILKVHSLVLTKKEDRKSWLKFASICQRMGNTNLSRKTLAMLSEMSFQDLNPTINNNIDFSNIEVTYGCIKHLWRTGSRSNAIKQLHQLKNNLQDEEHSVISKRVQLVDLNDHREFSKVQCLLNKCYLKLATWKEKEEGLTEKSLPIIMNYYYEAAKRDEQSYKAWHSYAYINFKALFFNKKEDQKERNVQISSPLANQHILVTHAVIAFFKSISLSNGNSLQDTLRLLTVLFEDDCPVYDVFNENLKTVPVETWIQVIPQLIARLEASKSNVAKVVYQILIEIGIYHPQALIYPLSVAQKSLIEERKIAAEKVLNSMREHSSNLVNQALMVNEELIRISILWHEMWNKGLEEACILFYHANNENTMIKILDNLFGILAKEPVTLKELAFKNTYGRDLNQAKELYENWKKTREPIFISQAWKIFHQVFQRLSYQMPNTFDLQYVSPKLLNCKNLELSIPGSYSPFKPITRIDSIISTLHAMSSKQRPKKLSMLGSNGQEFTFLLKGHEDLRQDERVMQLFGLVNTILANSFETSRSNLAIQRYAVIPLSHNCGLISFVPNCDTFHSLIKNYREKRGISINLEYQIMLKKAPHFDKLKHMQKVEIFEHALETTKGEDIRKILWEKSPNSEIWLERRTNYIRSFAVMSMVGYILGLGDRHPSNIMLHRLTGKILHIDLGDCFEVALNRDRFPEKVPFRLTRMFVNAMEVTGIDGTYRITCEKVMRVLRSNKDSLMAVLEAFVYDPLMIWSLNRTATISKDYTLINEKNSKFNLDPDQFRNTIQESNSLNEFKSNRSLNRKAVEIVNRISDKLTGRDFNPKERLKIDKQVDLLIKEATSNENLSQLYVGWCSWI